ncbi:MAG: phosphate/phosphite/phosphonate ABC transporter substrate-binding protein [Chloroflexota bacterium]
MKYSRLIAGLFSVALVAAACQPSGSSASPSASASSEDSGAAVEWPDNVVLGLVPSRESNTLVENAKPLTDALATALSEAAGKDVTVEGFVPTDYTALVEAMGTGQADIGAFGPFALLQARDRSGAEIILQSVRNGGATYHTQWFTNNPDKYCSDEPVENERTVSDAPVTFLNCNGTDHPADEPATGPAGEDAIGLIDAGTTVSFVEETSASGYIFPALQLIQAGNVDPLSDDDITRLFAGGHDASVLAVLNGDAEVGVSFDDARSIVVGDNPDVATDVVVFAYSPEIPNDGWAVRGDLPTEVKEAITQALLDYAASDEGKTVLDSIYEIDDLVPADQAAFDVVQQAAEQVTGGQ